jgi:hypothetical protein
VLDGLRRSTSVHGKVSILRQSADPSTHGQTNRYLSTKNNAVARVARQNT